MKVLNEKNWKYVCSINEDPYGAAVLKYAEAWADAMETQVVAGKSIDEVAKDCEPKGHHITGFMYGAAVFELSTNWVHGEELRLWHNKNYGAEGKAGVVNPAVLVLGEKS